VLERHADYIDARTRLAYIALKQSPNDEGPKAISKLYQDAPSDFEVRALYGWYLGRISSKKRSSDLAQDPELRHYKHTLQNHDKHDRYALIGMGNIYLQHAREMPRDTEPHRAKRSQMYCKALEFFEKALQLDPKNAYAAQGIAIAMVEEKKEHTKALPLFMQIRETVRDNANVAVNLGHLLTEMRQFGKAIESYEAALEKGKKGDAGILSCLGRVWLARGRAEKDVKCYRRALEYADGLSYSSPSSMRKLTLVKGSRGSTRTNALQVQRRLRADPTRTDCPQSSRSFSHTRRIRASHLIA
jgi:RNA polymerase-associated protein CTR9